MIFSHCCAALRECCVLCAVCSIERVQSRRSAQRMRGATSNTAIDLRAGAAFYNDTHRFYVLRPQVFTACSWCTWKWMFRAWIWNLVAARPVSDANIDRVGSKSDWVPWIQVWYAATSLGKWRIKKCTRCDLLMRGTGAGIGVMWLGLVLEPEKM